MKNIFRKFGFVIVTAALFTFGVSNLYANEVQWPVKSGEVEYQRYLNIDTGGSDF